MKRKFALIMVLLLIFSLAACGQKDQPKVEEEVKDEVEEVVEDPVEDEKVEAPEVDKVLRLTTTTSVNDSGLMDYLMEYLYEDTGIKVEIVSKGSGAAIEDGRVGNADIILVHSPAAEKEFVEEGYGVERKTFMHNFFVIVGPEEDPAAIKGLSAEEAFKAIMDSDELFVSRGDESGTHKKEENIWAAAGFDMEDIIERDNYNALGDGMGATLTFSSEKAGYTLTDLATFLSMESDLALEVLVDSSDSLKNEYSLILVDPEVVDGTNPELAIEFQDWMLSEKALELISKYGQEKYGQSLFFIN
ncbi:MAG: solute-binding protein [Tissierellia bacterium]|nr:solute-binding protein [Tissierellia bacterium]